MGTDPREAPSGPTFFEAIAKAEADCAAESLSEVPKLGISAPLSYQCLSNVLSLMYREASCQFGCPGGDHLFQRITARVVNLSMASLRLAMTGYYDESLSMIRSVGEIANLVFLFAARPAALQEWRVADEATRKREFAPVKIRPKLEALGLKPPVESDRYGRLSEVGTHVVPSLSPQGFDDHGRPTLGARFQYEGLMVVLNELGIAVAEAAACLSALLPAEDRQTTLRREAEVLLNASGSLDLAKSKELARGV